MGKEEVAVSGAKLGITDMWRERRHIQNSFWNDFVKAAKNEVWLFGIAELGYSADRVFHRIVLMEPHEVVIIAFLC